MRRKNEHGVSVMGEVLRLHRVVVQLFPIRGQHVSNPIRARLEKLMPIWKKSFEGPRRKSGDTLCNIRLKRVPHLSNRRCHDRLRDKDAVVPRPDMARRVDKVVDSGLKRPGRHERGASGHHVGIDSSICNIGSITGGSSPSCRYSQ